MKGKWVFLSIMGTVLVLALAVSLTQAQGPEPPVSPRVGGTEGESIQGALDAAPAAALGTGFTYQGQLKKDGATVNGTCDFQFSLWDAASDGTQIGTTQTRTNVAVSNGLFTIPDLDFGALAFQGDARWLAVAVRCPAGSGSYTTLSPRQALTAAPYALSLRPGARIFGDMGPGKTLWAQNTATSDHGAAGIEGWTSSTAGWGVGGMATASAGSAYGVFGQSNSTSGVGVFGWAEADTGTTIGVYGLSDSASGRGVYGYSSAGTGGHFASTSGHALIAEGPSLMGGRNPQQIALLRWYEANTTAISLTVGSFPDQLAFDGAHIWVTNWGAGTVTKIRASDGAIIGAYAAGSHPNPIAFDGYHIWVGREDAPLVTKIQASDGATVASFNAGTTGHWGMAFDGANIWVSNSGGNSVTKIRASDNVILGTYTTGNNPQGLAFDGTHIWVRNFDGTVSKLRASDGTLVGNYTVPSQGSYGVVFDGANIWVASAGNTVTKIRASDGVILGAYPAGTWPAFLVFDGYHIWVTNYNYPCLGPGTVTKLRASDGVLVGSYTVGRCPLGIAFDGANIWVANTYSHTVSKR